jgi:hypothetical protein
MDAREIAKELKLKLNALEEQQRAIKKEMNKLEKECEPKAEYGNIQVTVIPDSKDGEIVRIMVSLLNAKDKDDHMKIFGSISGDWADARRSVGYYRNEYDILSHTGGGWILLRDGIPCNNDEWANIKQGIIPDKFQN